MDHKILIQKLEPYRTNRKNLSWFKKYITSLNQYIQYNSNNKSNNNQNNINNNKKNVEKTELLDIICGVPQGSTLKPLLFVLYINDSQFLKPVMFDDDTSSFCSNKEIKSLFLKANLEL